jgi:hypothetical protein
VNLKLLILVSVLIAEQLLASGIVDDANPTEEEGS